MNLDYTYTGSGTQSAIVINSLTGVNSEYLLFSVKQGSTDISSIEIKLHKTAEWVTVTSYKDIEGDFPLGRIPSSCHAFRLNITENNSGNIVLNIISG